MATLTQLDATTSRFYAPSVVDNALLTNILFVKLWAGRRMASGGTEIVQPVMLTTPTSVGSYSGADVLQINYDQNNFGAEFPWAMYYGTVAVTGRDDFINMGPEAAINLLETRLVEVDAQVRAAIGADVQSNGTNNQGKGIIGLAAAVDDGSNVEFYGNIDRSVFTNWKANLSTSTSVRALTLDLLNTNAWNASRDSDRPDLYVTTRGVITKLTTLMQGGQRFREDGYLADIGFQNITYQGRPVVQDDNVATSPGSIIWGLNLKYFTLYVQEQRAFRYIPFQMAFDQDVALAKILVALQLVCSQCRAQVQIAMINPLL